MTALLEAKGLTKRFGAFTAVNDVRLSVAPGSIHSIIGPNGAGKTTLFRLITGILPPTSGTLQFAGSDISRKPVHKIARLGLVQSFQRTTIFPRLTARESVQAAIVARERKAYDVFGWFHRSCAPEADDILARVGLEGLGDYGAQDLSHGDQRALDVALALAVRPKLLLLDEPTAGMSDSESRKIMRLVGDLAHTEGLTVLFSEHDMDMVFGISETITVLHQGRVIADGPADQVRTNDEVMSIYLGEVVEGGVA